MGKFVSEPCACGHKSWTVAAFQGVNFTKEQAEAVAHVLNRPYLVHQFSIHYRKKSDMNHLATQQQRARDIIGEVAESIDVSPAVLTGDARTRTVSHARQKAYYRIWMELGYSYPRIGKVFGGRDHTTIMYGVKAHMKREGII